MSDRISSESSFVIKARELRALNHLGYVYPRPRRLEWINRGSNVKLRRQTVEQLLRTLYRPTSTPSISRLHDTSGLRVVFANELERARFARAFEDARHRAAEESDFILTAIYDDQAAAERALSSLIEAGISNSAISMVWRASQFLDLDYRPQPGHGMAQVAGAVAGSGVAGAALGVAVLFLPGFGALAAAGAIAGSAVTSLATVGGILGATGGAIAKVLTDADVEGVAARRYAEQIRDGRVFLCVDTRVDENKRAAAWECLGGTTQSNP